MEEAGEEFNHSTGTNSLPFNPPAVAWIHEGPSDAFILDFGVVYPVSESDLHDALLSTEYLYTGFGS